jgi:hypothetical protein
VGVTPYARSILRDLQAILRRRAPDRLLCAEIAKVADLPRREAARWLQEGDGRYWQSDRVRECLPGTKAPRWRRVYWWYGEGGIDGQD